MIQKDKTSGGLTRPVFFERQSLNAADLNCLVDYFRAERRRHNRHVIGWGVTCGLAVSRDPQDPWKLRIGPGHAIAPSGQEIEVPADADPYDICAGAHACLDFPDPCDTTETAGTEQPESNEAFAVESSPGAPREVDFGTLTAGENLPNPLVLPLATLKSARGDDTLFDAFQVVQGYGQTGLAAPAQTAITLRQPTDEITLRMIRGKSNVGVMAISGETPVDQQQMTVTEGQVQELTLVGAGITALWIVASAPGDLAILGIRLPPLAPADPLGTVFLTLCAKETNTCFLPEVPEYCRPPNDNGTHPARIREQFEFSVQCEPPDMDGPDCKTLRSWVCEGEHVPCPPSDAGDCLVIAAVAVGENGIVSIDEFSHRRRLAPHWVTAALEECCCCEEQPQPTPFTQPTEPTQPTGFTETTSFTDVPSVFTGFPSVFTEVPSVFTEVPSLFTEVPSVFTGVPSLFTEVPSVFTGIPSVFTGTPSFFSDFVNTGGPPMETGGIVDPGGGIVGGPGGGMVAFDADRGREMSVNVLTNVGEARLSRLEAAGVRNLTEFIEADSAMLSEALGLSEVRIAGMQEEARGLTRRGSG